MKITLHIGAHVTDGERLMRSLIRNSDVLSAHGVLVPGPSKFRNIMRDAATTLKGAVANAETTELVLDEIIDDAKVDHLILSYDQFMCGFGMVMAGGGYYARADRTAWLRNIFPGHDVRFAIGLRNPATHVPAIFRQVRDRSYEAFMQGAQPLALRWSKVIRQIQAANPGCEILAWCNEDTPLIWPELMRAVAALPPGVALKGGHDMLSGLLQPEGAKRLTEYLTAHPPQDDAQQRRILTAFMERYAKPEALEEEIDLAGWSEDLVDEISDLYDEDCELIGQLPGVRFLI